MWLATWKFFPDCNVKRALAKDCFYNLCTGQKSVQAVMLSTKTIALVITMIFCNYSAPKVRIIIACATPQVLKGRKFLVQQSLSSHKTFLDCFAPERG
ncbi:MAG: hypothetical protein DRR19_31395 [Candidatus Parabeggiatoa sp. nov. 1]|nr:MAG: hypothetical protein DRR19_31395 [Gammaproteobacteria bacterium]